MQRRATLTRPGMPIRIRDTEYLQLSELAEEIGVSRQTIWRWRKRRSIPQGNRHRGRVVFGPSEVQAVRDHSLRVEPILDEPGSQQGSLFEEDR